MTAESGWEAVGLDRESERHQRLNAGWEGTERRSQGVGQTGDREDMRVGGATMGDLRGRGEGRRRRSHEGRFQGIRMTDEE